MSGEKEARGRFVTIAIPVTLYNRIKELIRDTGFSSVSDFVVHVLREVVAEMERERLEASSIPEEEKKKIIERLKRLGYI